MNKVIGCENYPREFGTGDRLFPSGIHTPCVIGTIQGIRITNHSVLPEVSNGTNEIKEENQ